MTLELLFIAMTLGVAWQPSLERMGTVTIFAGVTVFFDFLLGSVDGEAYYMAGAFFALLMMYALSTRRDRLSTVLMAFCMVDSLACVAGWCAYVVYWEPKYYNNFYIAYYSCAVLAIYAGGSYGWGTTVLRLLRRVLRRDNHGWGSTAEAAAKENRR